MAIVINEQDWNNIEQGTPVLAEQTATVLIKKMEVVNTKSGLPMAKLTLSYEDGVLIKMDGSEWDNSEKRGAIWDNVMLVPSGKQTEEQVIRRVKEIFSAACPDLTFADIAEGQEEITLADVLAATVDQYVSISLRYVAATEQYPESNSVGRYKVANN